MSALQSSALIHATGNSPPRVGEVFPILSSLYFCGLFGGFSASEGRQMSGACALLLLAMQSDGPTVGSIELQTSSSSDLAAHAQPAKKKKKRNPQTAAGDETLAAAGEQTPQRSRSRLSVEELHQKIEIHARTAQEIREREREKERRRLEVELNRAAAEAEAARRLEEERRQQREEQIRERIEQIQARREQRELEHEVSKRRARSHQHAVSPTPTRDLYAQRAAALELEEEQRRQRILTEIREKVRAPTLEGLDHVERLLDQVKEHGRKREAEIREHRAEVERSYVPVYQGRSYEDAMLEHSKARHSHDDEKHARLYRQVKMSEYGRMVGQVLAAKSTEVSASRSPVPQFGNGSQPKILTEEARKKLGDEYLRTNGARKYPPGMKLEPLTSLVDPDKAAKEAQLELVKERERKGLQYLRELREKVELVRQQKPKESFNKSAMVDEIKQLRIKTNLLERKLLYGGVASGGGGSAPVGGLTNSMDPHGLTANSTATSRHQRSGSGSVGVTFDDGIAPGATSRSLLPFEQASFVDVVNAKLEMLKKLEELKRRAGQDDSRW